MFFLKSKFRVRRAHREQKSKQSKRGGVAVLLLLCPLFFLTCAEESPELQPEPLASTEDTSIQEEAGEPKIFLSSEKKTLSLSVLNRRETLLRLSDQIIFSDDFPELEESSPMDLVPLESFQKEEDLNMKISSFCSYEKEGASHLPSSTPGKLVQELASVSYHKQFSVFELVPKEIFLSQKENQIFYCSFIFAFRNTSGAFDHYQIVQQSIKPFFVSDSLKGKRSSAGNLFLVRESESGEWLPLGREIVNTKNVSKVTISNIAGERNLYYRLFCEGMEKTIIIGSGDTSFIFVNIMLSVAARKEVIRTKEGPVNCRVFSEGKGRKITGLSPLFKMDFSNNKLYRIDSAVFEDPEAASLVSGTSSPPQETESSSPNGSPVVYSENLLSQTPSSDEDSQSVLDELNIKPQDLFILNSQGEKTSQTKSVPLNSYFQFLIDGETSSVDLPYHLFIDIKVGTQCFNRDVFNEIGGVFYKEYVFPFRKSWPLMMVGSEEMFAMNLAMSHTIWRVQAKHFSHRQSFFLRNRIRDPFKIQCVYNIQLVDRSSGQVFKSFPSLRMARDVEWTVRSYGIHYRPSPNYLSISPVASEVTDRKKTRKEFLKLSDIFEDRAGTFHFELHDILQDSFFRTEGHQLTEMKMKCYIGSQENNKSVSEEFSWPFSSFSPNIVYLKSLFSSSKVRKFIEKNKLVVCRLLLYEKDLIRYFSEELKIVGMP